MRNANDVVSMLAIEVKKAFNNEMIEIFNLESIKEVKKFTETIERVTGISIYPLILDIDFRGIAGGNLMDIEWVVMIVENDISLELTPELIKRFTEVYAGTRN